MSSFEFDATSTVAWCDSQAEPWTCVAKAPCRSRQRGLTDQAKARVDRFIDAHIVDSIALADLAAVACMSRFHFARMFRVSYGRSPMEYVLARKVGLAKQLLLTQCQSIACIAATLGFCDQSHFSRSFRRITGCSPRDYLNDVRTGNVTSPAEGEQREFPTRAAL